MQGSRALRVCSLEHGWQWQGPDDHLVSAAADLSSTAKDAINAEARRPGEISLPVFYATMNCRPRGEAEAVLVASSLAVSVTARVKGVWGRPNSWICSFKRRRTHTPTRGGACGT